MHTSTGIRIKRLRKAAGLTQEELAKRMGKNISWVKNAETRVVRFSPDDIASLARALEVDPGEILTAA